MNKNNEMIPILTARDKYVDLINEMVGVQIQTNGILARPINIFVTFLEQKEIAFVQQISISAIAEFCILIRMHASQEEAQILTTGLGAFIYMCVSEGWVEEELALLWDAISERAFKYQSDNDVGLN